MSAAGGAEGGSGSSAGGMNSVIGAVVDNCKKLDQLRLEEEEVVQEIRKMHKKALAASETSDKSLDSILQKLRELYVRAKELAETEVSLSESATSQLDILLQSGAATTSRKKTEVGEQKKKRIKSENEGVKFQSAVPGRSQLDQGANLKGEQVAARVTSDDSEKHEWFVVKVTHYNKEANTFEVLDEEPGDDGESQKKYTLPASRIIPFPKKTDPSSAPDFPPGRQVLAVYPHTTALYKATVVNSHRKKKTDDYLLEFFDDEEEDGSLPQRSVPFFRVVPLPEGHRQ